MRGVCSFFQEGKCKRTNCKFEQRKLTEKELEKLARLMTQRRNPKAHEHLSCHHCGKRGHIAPNCPDKEVSSNDAIYDKKTYMQKVDMMNKDERDELIEFLLDKNKEE